MISILQAFYKQGRNLLTPIGGLTLFEGWGIIKEVGEGTGGEDRGETVVGT